MATYDEYVKFKNNKPEAVREIRTLEIYHPAFGEVKRLVLDYDSYTATLESSAPRNAGESVVFMPFSGSITESQESNTAEQSIAVDIGDLRGEVRSLLGLLDGFDWFSPVECIYRKYLSTDNTQPAENPQYLFVTTPSFENAGGEIPIAVSFIASDVDLSQKPAGIIYDVKNFPGLA